MGGNRVNSILFVCLGNICRSPIAEGVFRARIAEEGMAERFHVDSAGTSGFHEGDPPDPRSIEVCRSHGLRIDSQRSRAVIQSDFESFDLLVAMDQSNARNLMAMGADKSSVVLLLDYLEEPSIRDVPDPYYGGVNGFSTVFDLVADGIDGLLKSFE